MVTKWPTCKLFLFFPLKSSFRADSLGQHGWFGGCCSCQPVKQSLLKQSARWTGCLVSCFIPLLRRHRGESAVREPRRGQSAHSAALSRNRALRLAPTPGSRVFSLFCFSLRRVSRRRNTNDRCCYAKRGRHWREGVECCRGNQECSTKHERGKQNTSPVTYTDTRWHNDTVINTLYFN